MSCSVNLFFYTITEFTPQCTSLVTYDGNGNFTGIVLARSIAGNVTTNIANKGTYLVNSDCSFTLSVTRADGTSANFSGVVYDDGNKSDVTETDSGTIVKQVKELESTTHPINTIERVL